MTGKTTACKAVADLIIFYSEKNAGLFSYNQSSFCLAYFMIEACTWYNISEANGCHSDEAEVKGIKKCPVLHKIKFYEM
jgi:hypothetical protein